jgi:pimeloyl-ACP methyl ester carboxylesterase
MSQRTQFATTTDGITLGGNVYGDGPPVVFWHGAYGDGDLDWQALIPHLTSRFTCYLPSWRGRGLSDVHPDLSYGRRVNDVVDYVSNLPEPTGIVGWSGGANPVVAAAAHTDSLTAMALVEPTMGSVMAEDERATFSGAVARLGEMAADGELTNALRAAAAFPFNDEEIAVADDIGYFGAAGRYVPNLLSTFKQLREHKGPAADDPTVLGAISIPVLVVHGSDTKPFWVRSARHVAAHVPNARIHQIPAAGHAAPLTHPKALAEALTEFFLPSTSRSAVR